MIRFLLLFLILVSSSWSVISAAMADTLPEPLSVGLIVDDAEVCTVDVTPGMTTFNREYSTTGGSGIYTDSPQPPSDNMLTTLSFNGGSGCLLTGVNVSLSPAFASIIPTTPSEQYFQYINVHDKGFWAVGVSMPYIHLYNIDCTTGNSCDAASDVSDKFIVSTLGIDFDLQKDDVTQTMFDNNSWAGDRMKGKSCSGLEIGCFGYLKSNWGITNNSLDVAQLGTIGPSVNNGRVVYSITPASSPVTVKTIKLGVSGALGSGPITLSTNEPDPGLVSGGDTFTASYTMQVTLL